VADTVSHPPQIGSPANSWIHAIIGRSRSEAKLIVAEIFEIVVGAAGFVAGHPAKAAVDRLPFEAAADCLDFRDDVAARELGGAGAPVESFDGVEDSGSATRPGSASFACSGGTVIAGPWMVS
jgi:hypothetical protein